MHAAVINAAGEVVAAAAADKSHPCRSAVMRAFGLAGSGINLRDHTVVVRGFFADAAAFGPASLGACELFRPRAVVFESQVPANLRTALEGAGCTVVVEPPQ